MNSCAPSVIALVARPALGPVILPAERDTALVQGDESPVGDRDPMGIARQIREHRRRPGKRALGIDDPFALAQRREPVGDWVCLFNKRMSLSQVSD